MRDDEYVHGYSEREHARLFEQADTLADLLHRDTVYPPGSSVLEAGCGVGAQTRILAKANPGVRFTSVDISEASIEKAEVLMDREKITNVTFRTADIFRLPYPEGSFDHVFVCFVLEHLQAPVEALACLKSRLKQGGVDHRCRG